MCEVETDNMKGKLVEYDIENYGKSAPYYVSDNQILDEQIIVRRSRSWMPKEYVYKTIDNFDWNLYGEDVEAQKKISDAFIKKFDDFKKTGRGLYIYSNTKGSGKTLLACCLANEILKQHDISVKFISIAEYIEIVKGKSESKEEKINELLDASLLIIDDIGADMEKREWISNSIFRLVNRRYEKILPTIYTSNVPIDELKCDDRAVSRIYELSFPIVMPEKSIRKKKADEKNREFLQQVLSR